jgi:hypothetical protein
VNLGSLRSQLGEMGIWGNGVVPPGKITKYKLQKKEVSVSQRHILNACGGDVK